MRWWTCLGWEHLVTCPLSCRLPLCTASAFPAENWSRFEKVCTKYQQRMFGVEQQRLCLEGRWLPSAKKRTKSYCMGVPERDGTWDRTEEEMREPQGSLAGPFCCFTERAKSSVLHTWAPSARSRDVRLRKPLMALSTCRCRVSTGWEELASRAWPRSMASESRARPCHTSVACCPT